MITPNLHYVMCDIGNRYNTTIKLKWVCLMGFYEKLTPNILIVNVIICDGFPFHVVFLLIHVVMQGVPTSLC